MTPMIEFCVCAALAAVFAAYICMAMESWTRKKKESNYTTIYGLCDDCGEILKNGRAYKFRERNICYSCRRKIRWELQKEENGQ